MKKTQRSIHLFLAAMLLSIATASYATDIVVYRVGDGSAALTSVATAVFVDDYHYDPIGNTATLVGSIPMPTAVNGSNLQLVASGSATSEGLLNVSPNGQFVTVTGYGAAVGTASIASTASATTPRVVGVLSVSTGATDTSTGLTNFATGNNIRSAVYDGTNIWTSGAAGSPAVTTLGSTTATQISTTVANLRDINISGGQLYTSTSSGTTFRIGAVGTGTPTTAGQTIAGIPGFATSGGSPYQFYFADLDAGVAGVDTLYVADDGAGITKYSLVGGNWTSNGTVGSGTDAYRGLSAIVNGSSVTLFASGNGTKLVSLTDASGYNGAFSGSPTTLITVPTNEAFRGVGVIASSIPVPEPTSFVLAGLGIAGLAFVRRNRKSK